VTHVTRVDYTSPTNLHTLAILRPANWTYCTAAVAAGGTVINLAADPGVYSTNYKYALPGTQATVASVADNPIPSTDHLVTQLVDGTLYASKVSSVSGLAITMATAVPNVTGGGIAKETPVFFFPAAMTSNVITDKDPATGFVSPQWDTIAAGSGVANQVFQD